MEKVEVSIGLELERGGSILVDLDIGSVGTSADIESEIDSEDRLVRSRCSDSKLYIRGRGQLTEQGEE